MREGWLNDEYLILFSEKDIESISSEYGIDRSLPGYVAVGLRGWDDFIVRDSKGAWYSVPAVPLDAQYLQSFAISTDAPLQADGRFRGRIKWYVTPLIFGGSASDDRNVTWVGYEQHVELVTWWNAQYRAALRQEHA